MNPEKYTRSVSLLCPTCGASDFSYAHDDEMSEIVTCASCERELNKDGLIQENGENIDVHLSELKKEIAKDVVDELRNSLKKAFSGNKNIRFK